MQTVISELGTVKKEDFFMSCGQGIGYRKVSGPDSGLTYPACFILSIFIFLITATAFGETGIASFYGNGEKLNKYTANGEIFNPSAMTCASYYYPVNTLLRVTNIENGKSVVVRCNDLGPNKRLGRLIDLSREAFKQIASLKKGLIKVNIETVR